MNNSGGPIEPVGSEGLGERHSTYDRPLIRN